MPGKKFIQHFTRLLTESKQKNEFEFTNVLLGYKGMGELMSLTHFYESSSLFKDLSALITPDHTKKNNVRIGLFLYCHFFEMDELYRIVGNLLNIMNGGRFQPFLFEDLTIDELTPTEKIKQLKETASKCAFSDLTDCFDELYSNKLRNSFFHSNYSIDEGDYVNTSRRHKIKINGKEFHSLDIEKELYPLITSTIEVANFFFTEIETHKKSYTTNKIVVGTLSSPEYIVILGDPDKGLIGWESSSGSAMKITDMHGTPFLAAYNLRITPGKATSANEQKLNDIVEKNKYTKDDTELIKLEEEIRAENNPKLLTQLAIPYYNSGNNTKDKAEISNNIYEKKALLKTAISKYQKSLEFDPEFVRSTHNLIITETMLSDLNEQLVSYEQIVEKFESFLHLAGDFPEALFNTGHFSQIAAQDTTDKAESKTMYLKGIDYYKQHLKSGIEEHKTIERIAKSYWNAAKIDDDAALAQLALEYFEQLLKLEPDNVKHLLSFAGFLVEYSEIINDTSPNLHKQALKVLQTADNLSPGNSTILFRTGTTSILASQQESSSEEKEFYLSLALESFNNALAVAPAETKILNNIGLTHIKFAQFYSDERSKELFLKGIDIMENLIKNHPELSNSYYNKAQALIGLFEVTESEDYLIKAKEVTDYARKEHPGTVDDIVKVLDELMSKK